MTGKRYGEISRLAVIALAAGLIGCLWVGTGWHLWQKALVAEHDARHRLERLCRLVAQRLSADFSVAELQLETLRAHLDEDPAQVPGAEIAVAHGSGGWLSTQATVVLGTEAR